MVILSELVYGISDFGFDIYYILVVDDDMCICELLKCYLIESGFCVMIVKDVFEVCS